MISYTSAQVVEKYVDDVLNDRIVTGRLVRQAVERFQRDLAAKRWRFDWEQADRAVRFFQSLRHTQGAYAGKPFDPVPWQTFCVYNIHGFRDPSDDLRRYREAFLSVGRGNGKTPLGCGLVLYSAIAEKRHQRRLTSYLTATKRGQAAMAYSDVAAYIDVNPALKKRLKVRPSRHLIEHPASENTIEALSADGKTADGLRIWCLLMDEMHAWTRHQRPYFDKLVTAMGKFDDPLSIVTTTAGDDQSALWLEQRKLAETALDESDDCEQLFAFVAELDEGDDPLDESVWPKSNPSLPFGIVKVDYLRKAAEKASIDPQSHSRFVRYHGNRMVASRDRAFSDELWQLGGEVVPAIAGSNLYVGVDLGWVDDLAALGFVYVLEPDTENPARRFILDAVGFAPRSSRNWQRPPFADWIKRGLLVLTDSEFTETEPIYAEIRRRHEEHGITEVGFDAAGATEFATNCQKNIGVKIEAVSQTYARLNEPLAEFKAALSQGRVFHQNNPLLAWSAKNAVTRTHKGYSMLDKDNSEDKIDPLVACVIAMNRALYGRRKRKSVYERDDAVI